MLSALKGGMGLCAEKIEVSIYFLLDVFTS